MPQFEGALRVDGANKLRRQFKDLAEEMYGSRAGRMGGKVLTEAYREGSELVASRARSNARGGTPLQRRSASAIKAKPSVRGAGVRVTASSGVPAALAAFFGRDRPSGWYLKQVTVGSSKDDLVTAARKQGFPAWVGQSWTVGRRGEGPHAVNDAVADSIDEVVDLVERGVLAAAKSLELETF